MLDNLSGRQLQAGAEVIFQSGQRIGCDDFDETETTPQANNVNKIPDDHFDSEDDLPLSTFVNFRPSTFTWLKDDDLLQCNPHVFPEKNFSKYRSLSAIEVFELFANYEVIKLLVEENNRYALFVNCPDPKISFEEMKCFLAILIVSGYDNKPSKKSYWDSGEDLRNTAVYNAMRRDRFIQIMKFLHCADNPKLDPSDKMTKLRPLINEIKKNILENYIPDKEIDYDESMIEYFGRHGCKQYIRGKPIRFGYKVWSINSKNGYLINFEIYQGNIPNSNAEHQKNFGKAAAPLLRLVKSFPGNIITLPFNFYFDNLFTSMNLLYFQKVMGTKELEQFEKTGCPKIVPFNQSNL